jgi:hypothetical protein
LAISDADGPLKLEGRTVALELAEFELYCELNEGAAALLADVSDQEAYARAVGSLCAQFGRLGFSPPPIHKEYSASAVSGLRSHCENTRALLQAVADESGIDQRSLMQMEGQ